MNCPNCNNPLMPNQKFCDACGYAVPQTDMNIEKTQPINPVPEPAEEPTRLYDAPQSFAEEYAPQQPYQPQASPSEYPPQTYNEYQPQNQGYNGYQPQDQQPPQPPYQQNFAQPPQGYQNGGGQPPKKNNTPLIIVIIVLAVLLVGGGVFAAIMLLNNNKDGDKDKKESSSTSVSTSVTGKDDSSSKKESSKDESSKDESSKSESSRYESSKPEQSSRTESSSVSGNSTTLYDENGLKLIDDSRINTKDTTAQALLSVAISSTPSLSDDTLTQSLNGMGTVHVFAKGNAMVLEVNANSSMTSTQKAAFQMGFESSVSDSLATSFKTLEDNYGIKIVMVFALVNDDGTLFSSKVFSA